MKVKILRPYLDFEQGKTYTIDSENEALYMIAMSIAKKAVKKDGKEVIAPVAKVPVVPVPKKEDVQEEEPLDETPAADPEADFDDLLGDDPEPETEGSINLF